MPHEQPRKYDCELWRSAVKLIFSPTLVLTKLLGAFLQTPPRHKQWYASDDKSELYFVLDNDSYDVFICQEEARSRRRCIYE